MTTTEQPQPIETMWAAVHALDSDPVRTHVRAGDLDDLHAVLACLNACTHTAWGRVFTLARRLDQLATKSREQPDAPPLLGVIAARCLNAEQMLREAQQSLQIAREDMADLFSEKDNPA